MEANLLEDGVPPPAVFHTKSCAALIVLGCLICIAGGSGLLGHVGAGCPALGPNYASQFLGGGGEGILRQVLGQLGMLFSLYVFGFDQCVSGRFVCGSILIICPSMVFISQVLHWHVCAATCTAAIIMLLSIITITNDASASKQTNGVENQEHLVQSFKNLAIIGGLIVIFAMHLSMHAIAFWVIMFGRVLIIAVFLEALACLGVSGFQRLACKLSDWAKAWFAENGRINWMLGVLPPYIGQLLYFGVILGSFMNICGACISSFICDVTFVLGQRLAQIVAIFGGELMFLPLLAFTGLDILKFLVGNCDSNRSALWHRIMEVAQLKFESCDGDGRALWRRTVPNVAIIAGLVNLTGNDNWIL